MNNIAVAKINKEVFDEMNLYLEDGYDLKTHDLEEEATLLSVKAKFENGFEGIIEVFTGEESVMCTAYLYDSNGDDIDYIESDEGIDTEYIFETEKGNYTLLLTVEDNDNSEEDINNSENNVNNSEEDEFMYFPIDWDETFNDLCFLLKMVI